MYIMCFFSSYFMLRSRRFVTVYNNIVMVKVRFSRYEGPWSEMEPGLLHKFYNNGSSVIFGLTSEWVINY